MAGKKKILIAQSENDERETLAAKLQTAGYEIVQAKDGEEAFSMIQELLPDLVISDVVMPKVDGGQLLRKLRATFFGKDMPFMVMSNRTQTRDFFETMGVDDFISKPIHYEDLLIKIGGILTHRMKTKPSAAMRRVLIVGSNSQCVDTMLEMINKEGNHTDCVALSEQVIPKSVMFLPSIIIMESQMTGMQMEENIRVLRQLPQFRNTPILLYSYFDEAKLKKDELQLQEINAMAAAKRCLDAGATEYIGRFEKETFIGQIEKHLKKASIVIIDDDRVLVQLLKTDLAKEGYKIEAAPSGELGVDLVKKVHPHLVLLDLILPGMVGYDVLGKLKNDPATKDIPIMMMTVKGEDSAIQKALDLGAADYIVKPFHMGLLKKGLWCGLMDEKMENFNRPMFKKYFTPREANQLLREIKPIVQVILTKGQQLRAHLEEDPAFADKPVAMHMQEEIVNSMKKLEAMGCFYKDWNFEIGLVDFPALIEDKEALLCWRSDEGEILWFHSLDDGFAGRRPLPTHWLLDINEFNI